MVLVPNSQTIKEKSAQKLSSGILKNLLPRVFRTEGDVVSFNPVKIEQSIIRETGLDKNFADKITELVVR
ncbi:MAG: hypothetical protein ACXACC_10875, partial [Promethearchaeota archaeon]